MKTYARPTTTQFVDALSSTQQRYRDGLITRQTYDAHMRALWGAIETTPQMTARVRLALRRQTLTQLAGATL